MKRYTEKNKFDTHYGISISKNLLQSAYDKLGQLEDLEEELGCPLDIVFKLAKQRHFYYEENEELHLINCFNIELFNNKIYFDSNWIDHDIELGDFGTIELDLSDYKKTWWLKEDKGE